ncbi:hypothetical protein [Emticicia sp. TH156]|uniref:hypothetical protein n=1 Tax=Emticicia sp. TH156 TaxID=2067454 RepID=UPI000C775151|nr:hypothetical protein [Emticicia sp. TH156]PLK43911.1 hypothetical protein C0V77_12215 [Emticicia sp. TH156]
MRKRLNWTKIIGISFFIIMFFISIREAVTLEKHKKITTGTITGSKLIKGLYISYTYKIGSETYSGLTTAKGISSDDINKYLVGRKFPLIYDSLDFNKSDILFLANEFKALKIDYPDSLKWVCDSLKLKDCK